MTGNANKDSLLSEKKPASTGVLDELLQACAHQDALAFERLYRLSSPKLFPLAVRILKQSSIAEECLQEAYIRIWRQSVKFDPSRSSAMTWMATIVRNLAIDQLRRAESRHEQHHVDIADTLVENATATNADNAVQQVRYLEVERCLDTLKDEQRDCLTLAYFDGLTHEEVARRLTLPMGTVKTWIRRGLAQLKNCLE